jgi:type IX secretion system PorP/SprF family membrane protein
MKRSLFILLVLVAAGRSWSQHLPQYSQYMLNELAINPAVTGKDDFADVRSNSRHQWQGITDAPRTYILTVHGPFSEKHMGLGMNLFTDIVGPTRRTGLAMTYGYHLKLEKETWLSMGLSAGVLQWGIDGHKITLREEGDRQLLTTYQTVVVPDFGAGVYLHKKNSYYFGIGLPQLHQAPLALYPEAYKNSRLVTQLNVNGAYKFVIDEDFKVEPSFLVKYERPAPVKMDVGVRGIYKEEIWLGAVYRHNDAVSVLLGYMYKDYLLIGYSYDITTTGLSRYASGTHELMLGLRFTRKQAATWEGKK